MSEAAPTGLEPTTLESAVADEIIAKDNHEAEVIENGVENGIENGIETQLKEESAPIEGKGNK